MVQFLVVYATMVCQRVVPRRWAALRGHRIQSQYEIPVMMMMVSIVHRAAVMKLSGNSKNESFRTIFIIDLEVFIYSIVTYVGC